MEYLAAQYKKHRRELQEKAARDRGMQQAPQPDGPNVTMKEDPKEKEKAELKRKRKNRENWGFRNKKITIYEIWVTWNTCEALFR